MTILYLSKDGRVISILDQTAFEDGKRMSVKANDSWLVRKVIRGWHILSQYPGTMSPCGAAVISLR